MKHEIVETSTDKLGLWCSCGKGFPTPAMAKKHVTEANKRDVIEDPEQSTILDIEERVRAQESTPEPEPEPPEEIVMDASEERVMSKFEAKKPKELTVKTEATDLHTVLDLSHMTLNQIKLIGQTMANSGMFPDVKDGAKALVKILAGQEIGVTPFQAMTNIHLIQGKATMSANLMAAKVKGHLKYDYKVVKMDGTVCSIDFYEHTGDELKPIGNSTFTLEDAKAAGTQNLTKFPRNMLFARAMSNGCKWYTPDVFNGNLVYTPDEMGATVDADGEMVR